MSEDAKELARKIIASARCTEPLTLAFALQIAQAITGGYVSVYFNPDGWRARVGDTAHIAHRFEDLPKLLLVATLTELEAFKP